MEVGKGELEKKGRHDGRVEAGEEKETTNERGWVLLVKRRRVSARVRANIRIEETGTIRGRRALDCNCNGNEPGRSFFPLWACRLCVSACLCVRRAFRRAFRRAAELELGGLPGHPLLVPLLLPRFAGGREKVREKEKKGAPSERPHARRPKRAC